MSSPDIRSESEEIVPQVRPPLHPDQSADLHYKTQLEAVERISQALFQSIDLDELVETTLHIALEEVGAEAGSILLADPEKEELIFQYSIGDKPVRRGTGIPWDKGISGAVFQSGEARITNQINQDATHLHSINQTTGFITQTTGFVTWDKGDKGVSGVRG